MKLAITFGSLVVVTFVGILALKDEKIAIPPSKFAVNWCDYEEALTDCILDGGYVAVCEGRARQQSLRSVPGIPAACKTHESALQLLSD